MTDTETPETTDNVVPEDEFTRRRSINDTAQRALTGLQHIATAYRDFEELGVPTSQWLPIVIGSIPEPYADRFGPGAERSGAVMVDLIATFARDGFTATVEKMPDFIGRILGNPEGKPSVFATMGARVGMLFAGGADGFASARPEGVIAEPSQADRDTMLDGHDHEISAMRMRRRITKLFEEAPKMTLPDGTPDPSQAPALECTLVLRASIPPIQGTLSTTPEGGLKFASVTTNRENRPVLLEQFFDYADVVAICVEREIKAERKSTIIGAS